MKIGPYTLRAVETGRFALDGGAMFGIVPKTIWKTNPPDEQNRIPMEARTLLIQKPADAQGPALSILVDTGMGHKWSEKHQKIYGIDFSQMTLVQGLKLKGLNPEEITDVILTHLHFDHAGGMTRLENPEKSGHFLPVFPNARVWLQKRNWDLAWHPSEKDRASYLTENFSIYRDEAAFSRKLTLLDTPSVDPSGRTLFSGPDWKEENIYPGISVFVSNGHTLGMQLVRVSDGKTSLTYCADMIPTSSPRPRALHHGLRLFSVIHYGGKKKYLNQVADEKGYLFYEHCPHMDASSVERDEKGQFKAGAALELN